jgi:hypothetical protein
MPNLDLKTGVPDDWVKKGLELPLILAGNDG